MVSCTAKVSSPGSMAPSTKENLETMKSQAQADMTGQMQATTRGRCLTVLDMVGVSIPIPRKVWCMRETGKTASDMAMAFLSTGMAVSTMAIGKEA